MVISNNRFPASCNQARRSPRGRRCSRAHRDVARLFRVASAGAWLGSSAGMLGRPPAFRKPPAGGGADAWVRVLSGRRRRPGGPALSRRWARFVQPLCRRQGAVRSAAVPSSALTIRRPFGRPARHAVGQLAHRRRSAATDPPARRPPRQPPAAQAAAVLRPLGMPPPVIVGDNSMGRPRSLEVLNASGGRSEWIVSILMDSYRFMARPRGARARRISPAPPMPYAGRRRRSPHR